MGAPDGERAWGLSVLGEIQLWAGDAGGGGAGPAAVAGAGAGDRYSRALLADVLLDAGRPAEVRALLSGVEPGARDEALLLRLAIAERRLGGTAAPAAGG